MILTTIVPFEKTFLRVFDKPKKVRLTKQVIDVNFANLSPFKNGGHLFFQTETSIYVWYLAEPVGSNGIWIPEGYLLYRFFKERRDAVVLLPRNGGANVLILAKGELRAQVTWQNRFDQNDALELLKREFSLESPEVIRLDPTANFSVRPADLFAFAHFELQLSGIMEAGIAMAKAPLIAALLISAGFTLYQHSKLDSIAAEKKLRLEQLKRENATVQASIDKVMTQGGFWRDFIAREQAYPDFYRLLAQVTEVVQLQEGYLNNIEFNGDRITLLVGLKSSEAGIIKKMLTTGLFQEVKLLSSTKDAANPGFNLYNLAMTLRAKADREGA